MDITDSKFLRNSADGLEVDENGGGGVTLNIARSQFRENGPNPVKSERPRRRPRR